MTATPYWLDPGRDVSFGAVHGDCHFNVPLHIEAN